MTAPTISFTFPLDTPPADIVAALMQHFGAQLSDTPTAAQIDNAVRTVAAMPTPEGVPAVPVAYTATTQTAPPAADSTGLPYDSRIHSDPPTLTDKGVWRKRRGVTKEQVTTVEAELRQRMLTSAPAPATGAVAPTPVDRPVHHYSPSRLKLATRSYARAESIAVNGGMMIDIPTLDKLQSSNPGGITLSPEQAAWFTAYDQRFEATIARIAAGEIQLVDSNNVLFNNAMHIPQRAADGQWIYRPGLNADLINKLIREDRAAGSSDIGSGVAVPSDATLTAPPPPPAPALAPAAVEQPAQTAFANIAPPAPPAPQPTAVPGPVTMPDPSTSFPAFMAFVTGNVNAGRLTHAQCAEIYKALGAIDESGNGSAMVMLKMPAMLPMAVTLMQQYGAV